MATSLWMTIAVIIVIKKYKEYYKYYNYNPKPFTATTAIAISKHINSSFHYIIFRKVIIKYNGHLKVDGKDRNQTGLINNKNSMNAWVYNKDRHFHVII